MTNLQLYADVTDYYKPGPGLLAAINTALYLKRPLLLAGEPGTGKTECAAFVARQLHKLYGQTFAADKALRFNVKSVSQSGDLFYTYDAVAHFGDKTGKEKEAFISLNALGTALLATHPKDVRWAKLNNYESTVLPRNPPSGSVVLIDEIDKAPRDFPNDLLAELEKPPFQFSIKELPDADVVQDSTFPVVVIITSNNEKALPDAFLRRCIFYYINFPKKDELLSIVKSHLSIENEHLEKAVDRFLDIRRTGNMAKRPATSELIDWIACLQHKSLISNSLADWKRADPAYKAALLTTLGIIAKSKQDTETISQTIAG